MINLILKEQLANFTFITAKFTGSKQAYTYKTTMELRAGDLIVVEAPSGLTVVTVVDPNAEVVESPKYAIKWVVDVVDTQLYKICNKSEKVMLDDMASEDGVARL